MTDASRPVPTEPRPTDEVAGVVGQPPLGPARGNLFLQIRIQQFPGLVAGLRSSVADVAHRLGVGMEKVQLVQTCVRRGR